LASVGSKITVGGYASTSRSVLNDVSSAQITGNAHTTSSSAATATSSIVRSRRALIAGRRSRSSPYATTRFVLTRNITYDTPSVIASSTIASDAP
jgi:hypothetical protein